MYIFVNKTQITNIIANNNALYKTGAENREEKPKMNKVTENKNLCYR